MGADSDQSLGKKTRSWIDETLAMRGTDKIPPRLYKFVSVDSKYFPLALHELLLHNRIYLSCRKDFNDPFDTSVGLDVPDSPEAISSFIRGFKKRNPDAEIADYHVDPSADMEGWRRQAERGLDRCFDSIGIYSLADSIKHPLMWAHYASAHRGISLIFRHGTTGTFGAYPIRYQNSYPRMTIGDDGIDVYKIMIKGESWQYEGEWRMALSDMARQWEELPPNLLCGIVFGARASDETYQFVFDLIDRRAHAGLPPLAVYHARVGDSFDLDFFKLAGEGWTEAELA